MTSTEKKSTWKRLWPFKLWWKGARWPWQTKQHTAALDYDSKKKIGDKWGWKLDVGGMGRFGGGWRWKLGIECGTSSMNVYLIIGMLQFTTRKPQS